MTKKIDQDTRTSELIEMLRSKPILARAAPNRCLSDVECASLADGQLDQVERDRLMKHLAYCPDCLEYLTGVVVAQRECTESVPPEFLATVLTRTKDSAAVRMGSSIGWQPALAASLGVLLVSGLLISRFNGTPPAFDPFSITPGPFIEASEVRNLAPVAGQFSILEPLDGAKVASDKLHLRWSSVENGMFYEIQILSDVGDVVWQTRTENYEVQTPTELALQDQENYFILVRAYLHEGKVMQSRLHAFRIVEAD